MNILLFQTNIEKDHLPVLHSLLDPIQDIERWSIDLDDEDKVLRIVSRNLTISHINILLHKEGFESRHLTW